MDSTTSVTGARNIAGISLSVLLFASIFAIINYSTNYANAEEQTLITSSTSTTGSDEVAAASGSNRFVVWFDNTSGNWEIWFRRSTDNGATWKPAVNLSNNLGDSGLPRISVSGSNVYVVWWQQLEGSSQADIFFRRSTDNGVTWGPKINISSNGIVGSNPASTPQVTSFGSSVYVVWDQGDNSNRDIFFRRSSDGGATWKPVLNISNNKHSYDEKIAVSGTNVYLVWSKEIPGSSIFEIFFRRSTDGGATWKTNVNLSNNAGLSRYSDIAVSGSNIHVVWEQQNADGTANDIFFRRSTDNGATWKSSVNITSGGTNHSWAPDVVDSGSNVYVVWTSNGEIYFRRSTDNGATWKSSVNLSNNPGVSRYPQLALSGSNVYIAWEQSDAGGSQSDIFFRRSLDGGATWGSKVNLSQNGHSIEPVLAAVGSSVYAAWISPICCDNDIFFERSTDNGSTWSPSKNLGSNAAGRSVAPQIAT